MCKTTDGDNGRIPRSAQKARPRSAVARRCRWTGLWLAAGRWIGDGTQLSSPELQVGAEQVVEPELLGHSSAATMRRTLLLATAALSAAPAAAITGCTEAHGADGLNLMGGDLQGSPHALTIVGAQDPSACAAMCNATAACAMWTFHAAECHPGQTGPHPLCWLKAAAALKHKVGNVCTCSGSKGGAALPPAPPPTPPPAPPDLGACPLPKLGTPPKGAKNGAIFNLK